MHGFDPGAHRAAHRLTRDAGIANRSAEVGSSPCSTWRMGQRRSVELGLAIKERSPFRRTIVCELCNDSIGYVPTAKAYTEGGYEATSTPLAEGTGERLVEAALNLLQEAKRKA